MAETGCLKDGQFQNLEVEGNSDLSSSTVTYKMKTTLVTPASTAGVGTPTITLTAADSGTVYFCDISTHSAGFALPAVSGNAGLFYTFILNLASDAEATKDLFIYTESADVDILGPGMAGGVLLDTGVGTARVLQMDSSVSGNAAAGNRIKVVCDGNHWYILEASVVSANMFVTSDTGTGL
jgi:hypothetical protein